MYSPGRIFYMVMDVKKSKNSFATPLSRLRRATSRSLRHGSRRATIPQFAMVVLLRLAACSTPASQFSMVAPRLRTALRFACAVFRGCALRFAPCARHSSPSGLRCSRGSLAMFLALLGSSYRPALRWPGIPGLRSASRCPRPSTPSGLRRLRPVSATGGGLRAPLSQLTPTA